MAGYHRPRGHCGCCGQVVEYYSDGLSGGGHPYRCGNCFEGISESQLRGLAKLQGELQKLEDARDALLKKHQEGGAL